MECYLTIDDVSPPTTPPSTSTSTSSTTTICSQQPLSLITTNDLLSPTTQKKKNKSTTDPPTTLTFDMLGNVKKIFRHLTVHQKQMFLTELIGCCDNSLLVFINTLVAPKLKIDFFRLLPTEISLHILSYIDDPYTLVQASRVSTIWYSVLLNESIWKDLCYHHQYVPQTTTTTTTNHKHNRTRKKSKSLMIRSTPSSFKYFFRRQYQIEKAWNNGGAHITSCPNDIGNALVTSLQMDDEFIVVGCDNNRIEVFQATTGQFIRTLRGHHGGVWALQFIKTDSQCILVSGGCDRDARVWNLRTGKLYHTLQGHSSTIRCLKIRDSKIAVTGSRDASLRIWDIEHGRLKHLCLGHQLSVRCLDIRDKYVVSGSYDATARLWDIDTGECLFVCRGHQSQIYAVAIDNTRIVTGSLDSTIRVWSLSTEDDNSGGKCLATLHGHTTLVGHLQLLPDMLVSGGSDGCLRFWDLMTYECKHRISAHDSSVTSLQVEGKRVLSGGSDGSVKLWDLHSGQLVRSFTQPGRTVWKLECHATKAVVVIQRRSTHREAASSFHTAIELHDFDYQH
ncbi:WD40-repeat-containing domain protein [Halteromyces radiatus]|uniref:WD40-repeat-containing domain protein n=1 Tax=Halteromyces radiatus TaxID=101107 RepID=UPI0022205BC7|nr:WD40-repeat-containing domain protein [Halteromyces radiatus]KAI8093169.1 WD40-repeat-containing domain protein [Halteromyces radiatus]